MAKDVCQLSKSLRVIDKGRFPPEPPVCRIGRTHPGEPPLALDRGNQRRLLTADKCSRSMIDMEIKIEMCIKDIISQVTMLIAHFYRLLDPFYRQGIFCTNVHDTVLSTYSIPGQYDPLDDPEGVGFQQHSVHKGTGIAFIPVTDHILITTLLSGYQIPFVTGFKSGPSPSANTTFKYFIDHLLRTEFIKASPEGTETIPVAVFINIGRTDHTPELGCNRYLSAQKRGDMFLPGINGIAFQITCLSLINQVFN